MTALDPRFRTIPLAHRALHDRARGIIENSPPAFRAAVAAGYGIECDLQLSADGQAMVFHDDVLDRLTERSGAVRDLTAAELGQIALTGSDDCIPTLAEMLALVAGRVPLLIEIKDQSGKLSADNIGPLEQATAHALSGYGGPVAVMSFNPHSVAAMADLAPQVARGLTTGDFTVEEYPVASSDDLARCTAISDYDRVGASFVSHYVQELDHPRLAEIRRDGGAILCWTVRSREVEEKARQVVDNITFEGYLADRP